MKLIYLTAGAAGMYCGSCLHDNTLARALAELGHDVQLTPLYTPIRTDEASFATGPVFFGGINVYLQQQFSWFRRLPRWLTAPLDQPWLIEWASQRSVKIRAQELGALTLSMLRGEEGHQRQEAERLVSWIADERPDVVDFTNVLVAGAAPALRERVGCRLVATLQGDDIFLQDLPSPFREQAVAEIGRIAQAIDLFMVNSQYYADHMAQLLQLPREKFRIVPLGIDTRDFESAGPKDMATSSSAAHIVTIGYLARLAPEKGLHLLVDAFIRLREQGEDCARLKIAGWLGKQHTAYVEEQFRKLRSAGLADAYECTTDLDRRGKVAFLRSLDIFSVPTTYREPKGLFVLEALAAGVPVVQPAHGAFPELLNDVGGGVLVPPEDTAALAAAWSELIRDAAKRKSLGEAGRAAVHARRNRRAMAEQTAAVLERLLSP